MVSCPTIFKSSKFFKIDLETQKKSTLKANIKKKLFEFLEFKSLLDRASKIPSVVLKDCKNLKVSKYRKKCVVLDSPKKTNWGIFMY